MIIREQCSDLFLDHYQALSLYVNVIARIIIHTDQKVAVLVKISFAFDEILKKIV